MSSYIEAKDYNEEFLLKQDPGFSHIDEIMYLFLLGSNMIKLTDFSSKWSFEVRLIPRSSRNRIVGEYNGALKVQLNAPPVEGEANRALVRFLANELGLKRSQVELVSGFKNKNKRLAVSGVGPDELTAKIKQLILEEGEK